MKKIIAWMMSIMIGVLLTSLPTYAATISNVDIEAKNAQVEISGQIDPGENKQVGLKVFDPQGKLEYIGQTTSNEEGLFSFYYTTANPKEDEYSVHLGGEGVTEVTYKNFRFQQLPPKEIQIIAATMKVGGDENQQQFVPEELFQADLVVTNSGEQVRNVMIVIGLFGGCSGELMDFAYSPMTINPGETADFTGGFKLPNDVDALCAKVYVMDEGSLIPTENNLALDEIVFPQQFDRS